jgi:polysaccharide export outer membrane protein
MMGMKYRCIAQSNHKHFAIARRFCYLSAVPLISLGLLLFVFADTFAQQPVPELAASSAAPAKRTAEDTRYRIGPGDVLAINVRKAPELSGQVRVDQRGMIRIPMIEGEIRAACRTEAELAGEIARLYLEYKTNPNVEVYVADFQSRPVAVIGAVNAPGQFRLQRQVRLLELLSFAAGPSQLAGRVINVIHTGGPNPCATSTAGTETTASVLGAVTVYQLNDTLKGNEDSNPFVQPGDMVSLPDADQVFVIGHVNAPRAIPLKDKTITLSRAIAMAGGPARDGQTSKIRIIREINGVEKQELIVDLKAIQQQRAVDIPLVPNDVIEVGTSTSKQLIQILTGSASGAISNGVIRAIP